MIFSIPRKPRPNVSLFPSVDLLAALSLFFAIAVIATPAHCQPPSEKADLPQTSVEIYQWAQSQFWDKEYDRMEAAAKIWRESKEDSADGTWKLDNFYAGLIVMPSKPEDIVTWIATGREWVKQRPNSITARVALAEFLTKYAWKARGSGFSNSVTEAGFKLFRERLYESWQVLAAAKNLPEKCPRWFAAAQRVALGQGWPMKEYNRISKEGTTYEPDYYPVYSNALSYLTPRWYGKEGDDPKYALYAANTLDGEKSDILYARLMWDSVLLEPNQPYLGELSSFEKLDRGFLSLGKKFPEDRTYTTPWIILAYVTGNYKNIEARKERARLHLRELEDRNPKYSSTWKTGKMISDWAFDK